MTRILALLLLAAQPAWSQEAPTGPDSVATEAVASAEVDPLAAWEADRTVFLDAEGVDLGAFEYAARPLVVFGDSPRQPQVIDQLRLLEADIDALALRDVVVIVDTDPDARSALRQELRPRGFGLVLVDKDGRVSFRRPSPLSVREIARAIDRTPIRQEEIRNGRNLSEPD